MFNLLKKYIKEVQELNNRFEEIYHEPVQDICRYESDAGDCNLVQQLREKQEAKKNIDNEIKGYKQSDLSVIPNTYNFLKNLERYGFEMSCQVTYSYSYYSNSLVDKMFRSNFGASCLENALRNITVDEIDNLANELKLIKQRRELLEEKKISLKTLKNDIEDIKVKLGIE